MEHYSVPLISFYGVSASVRLDSGASVEELNNIHVCKECNAPFLFDAEITEHQAKAGHSGIYEISFSNTDESLV